MIYDSLFIRSVPFPAQMHFIFLLLADLLAASHHASRPFPQPSRNPRLLHCNETFQKQLSKIIIRGTSEHLLST
jgi:hypothetical protein